MSKAKAKQQTKENWFEKIFANPCNPYKIIFLVCIALYAQILTFGLVHFDDHGFVLMASDTLKISNISLFFKHSVFWVLGDTTQNTDIFYRPLQNVIYAVCNTIAAKQAWIYHFFGLMLHALTSCVLFRFFRALKYHSSVSLVFALIYSVHPALVQGVAWIAGMGDQIAALFSLLSAIYFIRLICPDPPNGGNGSHSFLPLGLGLLHLFFLTCALFSKEVSIALIPLCLFWFFFIHKNISQGKILFTASFSWIAITLVYFMARANAIHPPKTNLLLFAFESFKVNGAMVFEYFEKIFLPYRLSPIPSREDAQLLMGGIIFLGLISLFVFRKRFIGILIIMMELVNISRININSGFQKYGFASVGVIFFAITFSHSKTFTDPYTFYDKAISSSPQSVIAYNGFGKLLLEDKKYEEAVEAFKKSFKYKSDDLQTSGKIAEIYLKNLNNPQEAITWFKKTLDIDSNSVEAAVSIGDAYFNFLHDTSNAMTWYAQAIKINPHNEFALANLGVLYASQGKNAEARKYLSEAMKSNPKNGIALKWMAISYFNEGKITEAVNYLNKGYAYYPNDTDLQRNLMICYYKLNDFSNTKKFASLYSKGTNQIPSEIAIYLKDSKH